MKASKPNLLSILAVLAAREGAARAFIDDAENHLSYQQWLVEARAACERFQDLKVSRIALHVEAGSWLSYPVLLVAAVEAGIQVLLVRDPSSEMAAADAAGVDMIIRIREGHWHCIRVREPSSLKRCPELQVGLFTSGTSGEPKLVLMSEQNLVQTLPQNAAAQHQRCVYVAPVGTHLAQVAALRPLASNATIVVARKPGDDSLMKALKDPADIFTGPPHVVLRALRRLEPRLHPRRISLTADVALPAVLRELHELAPNSIISKFYTTTEAYPAGIVGQWDPNSPWTVGRAAHGSEVVVGLSPTRPQPIGQHGKIWLKSQRAQRLVLSPEEFSLSDAPGRGIESEWVDTGDLGYMDSSGLVSLVERESDVVKVNSERVNLNAISNVLLESGLAVDCAVVSLAGDKAVFLSALVVPTTATVTEDDLRRAAIARLPIAAVPARILLVSEIPRNAAGKIDRRSTRNMCYENLGGLKEGDDVSRGSLPPEGRLNRIFRSTWGSRTWAEVLGIDEEVAVQSENLLEHGADSLALEEILARAYSERYVELDITALLQYPTVAALDRLLDGEDPES